jgi:predicted kinase
LSKPNAEKDVISVSWLTNNWLLYLFALADTRGRKTTEMSRAEENLELWKMLSEDHGCLHRPYPFANDHARFLFYRDQLSSLHYTPHEQYRCQVTLMSGVPGAGKDTWLAHHHPKLPTVSLDAVRAELDVTATDNQGEVIQTAREQCREHLRAGRDFAFNATNVTRLMRKRWIDLFADYSARIEIVYIEPPLSTILEQNKKRTNPVPEKVITHLVDNLEPPTFAEAHQVIMTDNAKS